MGREQPPAARDGGARRGGVVRVTAFALLVAAAALLLPVSALTVEALAERAENWILVLHVAVVAGVGAAAGALLRRLGPTRWSAARRAVVWAGIAMIAAAVANLIWLVLLAG